MQECGSPSFFSREPRHPASRASLFRCNLPGARANPPRIVPRERTTSSSSSSNWFLPHSAAVTHLGPVARLLETSESLRTPLFERNE